MSFTPALLANRRKNSGGTFTEQVMGPVQATVLSGALAARVSSSAALVPTFHASTAPGDLLVLCYAYNGTAAPTLPSGWSDHLAYPAAGYQVGFMSKVATAADVSAGSVSLANTSTFHGKAWVLTVPGRGWKVSGNITGSQTTNTNINSPLNAQPGNGLTIVMFTVGVVQASITPGGTGTWTTQQNLPNNSVLLGWTSPTASNQNLSITYPSNSITTSGAINIVNEGFKPWSSTLPAPWVEIEPSMPYDTFMMDMALDMVSSGGPNLGGARLPFEFGLGAAGSEVSVYNGTLVLPPSVTSGQVGFWIPPVSIPLSIKAGQRLAMRGVGRDYVNTVMTPTLLPPVRLSFAGV